MTEGSVTLTLRLSHDDLMRAAAIAGHVVGEDQFNIFRASCATNGPLNGFMSAMAIVGIGKAIAESYERRIPYRPDDDLDSWLWQTGYHAFTLSEHPGEPDHE
jgi:hypothetical protein